jgi:hypothetical protein
MQVAEAIQPTLLDSALKETFSDTVIDSSSSNIRVLQQLHDLHRRELLYPMAISLTEAHPDEYPTPQDALMGIAQMADVILPTPSTVLTEDMHSSGGHIRRARDAVKRLDIIPTRRGEKTESALAGYCGSLSHQALMSLYTGEFMQNEKPPELKENGKNHIHREQQEPEYIADPLWQEYMSTNPLTRQPGNKRVASDIARYTRVLHEIIERTQPYERLIAEAVRFRMTDQLYQALLPVFGSNASALCYATRSKAPTYFEKTLLCWADAYLALYNECHGHFPQRIIFSELPLFRDKAYRAGRLDGIEVMSIKGHEPDRRQKHRLAQICESRTYHSVEELIQKIEKIFRTKELTFRIIDFKCEIGDNPGKRRQFAIPAEQIATAPIKQHAMQIAEYAAHLDGADRESGEITDTRFIQTQLIYFISTIGRPFVFETNYTNETLDEAARQIAQLSPKGVSRASMRESMNILLARYESLLHGKGGDRVETPEMFSPNPLPRFLQEKREMYQGGGVEYIGDKKGERQYIIHLARLLEHGSQETRDGILYAMLTGDGFIPCPIPEHEQDNTPSCMFYLSGGKPHFKCFGIGCQAGGEVLLDGIQTIMDMGTVARPLSRKARAKQQSKEDYLSSEHIQIMSDLQTQLQENYSQLRLPKEYIRSKGIDPTVAFTHGAGYGGERGLLIAQMKKRGYTEEQLLKYGVIMESATGYRYCALSRRLTFPLMIVHGGSPVIETIYGRAVDDVGPRLKHRKLLGIQKGLFNIQDLGADEITIAEGAKDALILKQTGYYGEHIVALIGTLNYEILKTILSFNPAIIHIALDFDAGGQKGSRLIEKHLRELGFDGIIHDLSLDFALQHQAILGEKDDDWASWNLHHHGIEEEPTDKYNQVQSITRRQYN